jgi:hypothetical protein
MKRIAHLAFALVLLAPLAPQASAQDIVTVDPTSRFQVFKGLEVVGRGGINLDPGVPLSQAVIDEIWNRNVVTMGATRLRVEIRDSDEPTTGAYDWTGLDDQLNEAVLVANPLALSTHSQPIEIALCYVGFSSTGIGHPHESNTVYSNFVVAAVQRIEANTSVKVTIFEPQLEPDGGHGTIVNTQAELAAQIVAVRAALDAAGLQHVKISAPSAFSAGNCRTWMFTGSPNINDDFPAAMAAIEEVGFHGYGGFTTTATMIGEILAAGKIPVMNEWTQATSDTLFDLLSVYNQGVQRFEKFGPYTESSVTGNNVRAGILREFDNATPQWNYNAAGLRQMLEFIRPGSQRIGCSTTGSRAAMAWRRPDGKIVVVVRNGDVGAFYVRGLPSGTYAISYAKEQESADTDASANVVIDTGDPVSVGTFHTISRSDGTAGRELRATDFFNESVADGPVTIIGPM